MEKKSIQINKNANPLRIEVPLASSKSESNRVLIMKELAGEGSVLKNLSSARDTHIMSGLLASKEYELNAMDAGTVMRFMTAYLTRSEEEKILTGTERMCQRPIGLLVEALNKLGSDIQYVKNEGYPPLKIKGTGVQK